MRGFPHRNSPCSRSHLVCFPGRLGISPFLDKYRVCAGSDRSGTWFGKDRCCTALLRDNPTFQSRDVAIPVDSRLSGTWKWKWKRKTPLVPTPHPSPRLQAGVRAPLLQGLPVPALPHPAGGGRSRQPEVPTAKVQAGAQPLRAAADADRRECRSRASWFTSTHPPRSPTLTAVCWSESPAGLKASPQPCRI